MHHTFHKSSSISMSRFRSNAQSTNCEKRTLKKGVVRFHKFWLVNPTWSPLSPTIPSNSAFQSCIWPTHWIQYNWKRYYKLWILNKSRFNPYRVSQSEQKNFDTSFLKKGKLHNAPTYSSGFRSIGTIMQKQFMCVSPSLLCYAHSGT